MRRPSVCRLVVAVLLGGVAACGPTPAPPKTVDAPINRFPKGSVGPKIKDAKPADPGKTP